MTNREENITHSPDLSLARSNPALSMTDLEAASQERQEAY
jgi:hypothetical protein